MTKTFYLAAAAALVAQTSALPDFMGEFISRVPAAANTSKVQFAGVNIAGFDFGCGIDGTCNLSSTFDIAGKGNGVQQMQHFTTQTGLNAFRLPVGWQFLVNNVVGAELDPTNFATYDALVQGCLKTDAQVCIVDVHNYARFNGKIIGQGGPPNDALVSLWTQLAKKYVNEGRVAFGVMNEPHDIPDIETWGETVQAVVTAIRGAGATKQMILMPGNNFTSAGAFIDNGSAAALSKVKNPDGSITMLVFDVHKYLDSDNSGTHTECVTNNIDSAFTPLAKFLRENKRMAFLTETGGGNTASCLKLVCEQLTFLNQNNDVFLGWIGWSAGGFDQKYELSETPAVNGSTLTDSSLMATCIAGKFTSGGKSAKKGKGKGRH